MATIFAPLLLLAVAPLPTSSARWLARRNGGWLVGEFGLPRGHGVGATAGVAVRKLAAVYIQYQTAHALQRAHHVEGSDVERLVAQLRPLRLVLLNQREVAHRPANWSTMLSGVGYCDQVNGVAANVLAGEFKHSQLYAILDTVPSGAGHVIGRVWSDERRDWLYYDLWNDIVVFTASGNRILMLANYQPVRDVETPDEHASFRHLYESTRLGWVMNEYRPTFLQYIASKVLRDAKAHGVVSLAPTGSLGGGTIAPDLPVASEKSWRDAYASARVDMLLGSTRAGRRGLDSLARTDATPSALGEAARLFAMRSTQ